MQQEVTDYLANSTKSSRYTTYVIYQHLFMNFFSTQIHISKYHKHILIKKNNTPQNRKVLQILPVAIINQLSRTQIHFQRTFTRALAFGRFHAVTVEAETISLKITIFDSTHKITLVCITAFVNFCHKLFKYVNQSSLQYNL